MLERVLGLYERARESLLVVPAVMVVLAGAVAWLAIRSDLTGLSESVGFLLVEASVPSARAVLTTVAGATATVAGIVFALTAVAVQLASSQYSPRVIQGYMRDGLQQAVIGLVGGTFTFALLALASVGDDTDGLGAAPRATVTVGVVLGVASFLGIIVYIDHAVRSLRADSIIRRLTDQTRAAIRRYHPEEAALDPGTFTMPEASPIRVAADERGWIRSLDRDGLLDRLPPGTVVRLDVGIGSLVHDGRELASVWADDLDEQEAATLVRSSVAVGRSRTLDQDPIYGFRLLSDIALRALSPGINDPTTAVTVVHHLGEPLEEVLTRDLPPRVHRGDDGRRLYEPARPDDADFVRMALREVRLAANGHPEVLEAIAGLLVSVDRAVGSPGRRHDLLVEEARAVLRAAATLPVADRVRVREALGPLFVAA